MTEIINENLPYFGEEGLNCAESSLRLLIERGVIDLPLEVVKLMTGLGGGVCKGGPCGAVVGCTAAIGSQIGRYDPAIPGNPTWDTRNKFLKEFEMKYGHIACDDLMYGVDKTTVEMQKKCSEIVLGAVEIATKIIDKLVKENSR